MRARASDAGAGLTSPATMKVHLFGAASGIGRWTAEHLLSHRDAPWQAVHLWDIDPIPKPQPSSENTKAMPVDVHQLPAEGAPLEADFFAVDDLVLLAVPASALPNLARALADATEPGITLVSMTSTQKQPLAILEAALPKANVIGLHLLFGPSVAAEYEGQNAVLVWGPSTSETEDAAWHAYTALGGFLQAVGMRLSHRPAAEHDRVMGYIQALTHFSLLTLGDMLREAALSEEDLQKLSTPTFRGLTDLIAAISKQTPTTLSGIQAGPANKKLRDAYIKCLQNWQHRLAEGDWVDERMANNNAPPSGAATDKKRQQKSAK